MKISLLVAFTCTIYLAHAATVYSPENVRPKRSPVLGAAAIGGAGLLGAGALGAGLLGAGALGAGALGAGALGVGVAKGALIGGAIGKSFGGHGGYYGHSSPTIHVVHEHYGGGYDGPSHYGGGYGYGYGYGYGGGYGGW